MPRAKGRCKILKGCRMAAAAFLFLPVLAGCSMDAPTNMTEHRVRVQEDIYDTSYPAAQLTGNVAAQIGDGYRRFGEGPVALTVTYDPHSPHFTARGASEEAARIAGLLRREGITDVRTETLPVMGQDGGPGPQALVRYRTYTALPPEGCRDMEDYPDNSAESLRPYKLGCSTESYLAKQVASPRDLLGRDSIGPATGSRLTNIVNSYGSGEPNPPLTGLSASE